MGWYDQDRIGPTIFRIQSDKILTNVITQLNLNKIWGEKYHWQKGDPKKTILVKWRKNLEIQPIRNTKLITISFTSTDPKEAAQIANAIAQSYRDYDFASVAQVNRKALAIFEELYQTAEQQICNQQTQVEQLRLKYGIQDLAATNGAAVAQTYWDEKRKLDGMREQQTLLNKKIEMQKEELRIPRAPMVYITDLAEPPAHSVGPNRPLGAVLLVLGLFSCAVGWRWLQASTRPPHAR